MRASPAFGNGLVHCPNGDKCSRSSSIYVCFESAMVPAGKGGKQMGWMALAPANGIYVPGCGCC